jgi:arginine/serine-rich splicing factor 7
VREAIHVLHPHAVDGAAAGATAEAGAIGMLRKGNPSCYFSIGFFDFVSCFFILFLSFISVCQPACVNNPSITISRSRSPSGSPRGGRRDRDERRSRSVSYSRSASPRRSVSPAKEKERSRTPDGSRSPRSPSPRDDVSPPPKDNGARNGSDREDSPGARENSKRSRSPSDGYRSPAANGRSPSPRDDRSPSPKGDNGDDERRGSPRGSQSP